MINIFKVCQAHYENMEYKADTEVVAKSYCRICKREKQRQFRKTEKGKESVKSSVKKYAQSDKGKEILKNARRIYATTPKRAEHSANYYSKYYK